MKIALYNPHADVNEFAEALAPFEDVTFVNIDGPDAFAPALEGAEILIAANRTYEAGPAERIRACGKDLKWIAFMTSGIDKAIANGFPPNVVVTNVAGLRAFAVAEHALYLMLALVRRTRMSEQVRTGENWARNELSAGADNLTGKRLLILGAGAIGQEIARKAKAFDMHVTGISRSSGLIEHFDRLRPRPEFAAAAGECDMLVVATLADESTKGIISREIIAAMQPHAFLVNIARGSLVDEPALIQALQHRQIAGAGLDVQETEPLPSGHALWHMDNVILTPHIGGAGSSGLGVKPSDMFVDNLRRWRAGEPLDKIVIEKT